MKLNILLSLLLVLSFSVSVDAQYLRLDTVNGSSNEMAHRGWIEIESYSIGPDLLKIKIVKRSDKSTPKLLELSASGARIALAEIEFVKDVVGRSRPYEKIELRDVRVVTFNQSTADDFILTEEIQLSFERITVVYTDFDEAGRGTDFRVSYDSSTLGTRRFRPTEIRQP